MTAACPRPRAKLKPAELGARIEREGLERLYLIAGDEPYQCLEAMDRIRSLARALGATERVVLEAQAGFNWQRLRYEANHLSLFSDRRLIELTLAQVPPQSEGAQAIIAYTQGMSADSVVVIRAPVIDYRAKQGAWYQAIEAAGVIVEVAPVPPEAMPDWILRLGERRGLILDQEAAMFIAERVENNLPAASQELEKLRLSLPGGKVGLEDVVAVVTDSSRYDVFALVSCVLEGRLARSLSVLAGLRAEGTEAALVTWSLVRELRILCRLA
ncbi:MAG: DNA polymerase III subunit delta, partial [Gammaproteobacteria bacterium]